MAVSRPETTEERLKTTQNLLASVEAESQTLSARVTQVANPQYVATIQARIQELDDLTLKLSRKQRSLVLQQQHREKELSKATDGGDAEVLQQINAMKAELHVVEHKTNELAHNTLTTAQALGSKATKLRDAKAHWKQLLDEAVAISIDVSVIDPTQAKESPAFQKCSVLATKKEGLQSQVNLLATRQKVTQHEYAKKVEGFQQRLSQLIGRLQERTQ